MSSCRISPISPIKTTMLNTSTSTSTMQLQLRRSISVENETGAATLAFLAALVNKSNCTSIKKDRVGEVDTVKIPSSVISNSSSTEKDCANVPIIDQNVETIVLQSTSQSSVATTTSTTTVINSSSNTSNNTAKSSSISQNLHHQIPSDILDDLASRFIINTPVDERQNFIRICFQIELAHWFYLDFFCGNEEKKLIPCGLKQFASHLFQHIPFLCIYLTEVDKILEDWKEYKLSVPTYGAILVSEDLKNVLLVQSYWAKSSWGFPKGKINEHESPVHCATREVYEETGFDITNMIVPDHYIECVINYQYTRLYIVRNVPTSTNFLPRTRKEIKCCEWFPLDSLPTTKNDTNCKSQLGVNPNSFFMIIPFMKRLKKWISDNRSGIERKYSSSSPITTFNNNNGCSNYYTNNPSGNYNYSGTGNGLVKPYSSAKKFNLDFKKGENSISNTNNGSNNQLKGTINENSDNMHNDKKNKENSDSNDENNDSNNDNKNINCIDNNNNHNKNNIKNFNKNDNDNMYNNNNDNNNNNNNHNQNNSNNNYNNDKNNANNGNNNKNIKNNKNKNNNNNQKNKRQRHKSMGDIDGINLKLNFMKNNGNNNVDRSVHQQQSCGYDKANNSASKINCNNKDGDTKKRFFEDNIKYSSNKHANSKRQLFSCISTDGSTNCDKIINNNNINSNFNGSKKDKDKISNNNNNNNSSINKNGGNNNNINNINNNINTNNNNTNNNNNNNCNNSSNNNNSNNNNSVRLRTKSLGQHSNLQSTITSNGVQRKNSNENKDGGNMRRKSHNLQNQQLQTQQQDQEPQQKSNEQKSRGQTVQDQNHKENINNNKNNNHKFIIDSKVINNHHNFLINSCTNQQRQFMKLKQQHEELRAEQEKNQLNSQHIVADNIKFNPNIDSWTNFSFTKNFIANVFC
ncbi:putative uncharacterized protein DDB_G0282133 [Condylostylus longicornis]|uniref:putative uncharacterized protein DDB_G0282133 n=1 Tax=Condylostylus longicornis TaxID=2530218 RepID=UPI00244E4304|nr:putative uncharacterized protein DDB_G0282133 [Condylostylus longicornis]